MSSGSTLVLSTQVTASQLSTLVGQAIADLTNPTALTFSGSYPTIGSISVAGGLTTITLNSGSSVNQTIPVTDTIAVLTLDGQGLSIASCGGYEVSITASSGYGTIANPLHFFSLDPSIVPGMYMGANNFNGIPTNTTITSITVNSSTDTTVVINNPITQQLLADSGTGVIFFNGSSYSVPTQTAFCSAAISNNIIAKTLQPYYINGQAILTAPYTFYYSVISNWIYDWQCDSCSSSAGSFGTQIQGTNNTVTGNQGAGLGPTLGSLPANVSIEAYDTSLGGPGTAAHFIAQARLQSKANWDNAWTACGANDWFRSKIPSGPALQGLC